MAEVIKIIFLKKSTIISQDFLFLKILNWTGFSKKSVIIDSKQNSRFLVKTITKKISFDNSRFEVRRTVPKSGLCEQFKISTVLVWTIYKASSIKNNDFRVFQELATNIFKNPIFTYNNSEIWSALHKNPLFFKKFAEEIGPCFLF